jgi:anti-sigma regulatory factor (Ser/Thr protein kinase)
VTADDDDDSHGLDRPPLNGAVNGTPQELRLDLPAVHSAARMARHLVRQFARAGGLVGSELDQLVLVADELLSNAVDHGGGGAARSEAELERPVRMTMMLGVSARGWEMHVADQGGGDPLVVNGLMHPEGLPDLEDERGRGFFLMAQMVDSLRVAKSADGLGLEMIAKRTVPSAGSEH